MTTQSTFPMNDLVLRLTGGQRDGELIPVSTPKCYLGMDESNENGEQPQCAIFRGPKGAAVKSYADDVLVNGIASTVHWLKEGDRIDFPNSISIEVTQLGWVELECEEHLDSEFSTENKSLENPIHDCEQNDKIASVVLESAALEPAENENLVDSSEAPANDDQRLNLIEAQINEIHLQKENTEQKLNQLDEKLSALTEQMNQLVLMASGSSSVAAKSEFNNFVGFKDETVDQQVHKEDLGGNSESELPSEFQPEQDSVVTEPTAEGQLVSQSDYYSYTEDDDEKILTYDASEDVAEAPKASHVESNEEQTEIESRQSELEKVFGSALSEEVVTDTPVQGFAQAQEEVILRPASESAQQDPTEDDTTTQTANEQLSESFNTPTHGLDDDAASFADYTTDSPHTEIEPGSLACQLLSEVAKEELEAVHSEAALAENETNEDSEEIAEKATETEPESGGVADLLARMKAEGKWDGVPDGDEDVDSNEPVPAPFVEAPVEPVATGEPEDDVQDYMSQLLSRMRGDAPAPKAAPAAVKPAQKSDKVEVSIESEKEVFVPPVNPLKAEEFKPKSKAQKIDSLGKMRELANSTARSNVKKSEARNRKELGYVQIGIAVCSFFMAVYYFLVQSVAIFDTGFIVGFVCLGTSGYLGYRFYSAMRNNELIEANPKLASPQNDAAETATSSAVVPAVADAVVAS